MLRLNAWSFKTGGGIKAMFYDDIEGTRVGFLGHLKKAFSPPGLWGEPWPTGSAALWAALLLGVMLVLSFA